MKATKTATKYPGIYKVDGGYEVRATAVDPRTGLKRDLKRQAEGLTLDGALALQLSLRKEIQEPPLQGQTRRTLGDYAKSWLTLVLPDLGSELTRTNYTDAFRLHIVPDWGTHYLDAIGPESINAWTRKPRGREYSPVTVNGWLRLFCMCLRQAVVDCDLPRDPTRGVKYLRIHRDYEEGSNSLVPGEELKRFLVKAAELYPQWMPLVAMGFLIGARMGELRPLRWDKDVDLEHGLIHIRRSQRGRYINNRPKNGFQRNVAIHADVVAFLRRHRWRQLEGQVNNPMGLVFPPSKKGSGYLGISCLDKPFMRIAAEAAIGKHVTPKGMRRTFYDLARAAGVPGVVRRAMAGHGGGGLTSGALEQGEDMEGLYSTPYAAEMREGTGRMMTIAGIDPEGGISMAATGLRAVP